MIIKGIVFVGILNIFIMYFFLFKVMYIYCLLLYQKLLKRLCVIEYIFVVKVQVFMKDIKRKRKLIVVQVCFELVIKLLNLKKI